MICPQRFGGEEADRAKEAAERAAKWRPGRQAAR